MNDDDRIRTGRKTTGANACALAIAARAFNVPSETFIRDHVRLLAPDATALICDDATGTDTFACPVFGGPLPSGNMRQRPWRARLMAPLRRAPWPRLHEPAERHLAEFLEAHRPRALLAEHGTTGCRVLAASLHAQVPLFVHFHGADATTVAARPRWRKRYQILFAEAAGIFAPSRFLAGRLRDLGCPKHKLHVSPNGLDPSLFRATTCEAGRVLAVGRLVEKKGPQFTLEAFARVKHSRAEAHLDIIGDGPLYDECRSLAANLSIDDAVTFHGAQPHGVVTEMLSRAALFVQHSVTTTDGDMESFGISLLEAQASAVPVVATQHNGFADTVVHGQTGLLVPERDVPAMADAMALLLSDSEKAGAMGAAGRARVRAEFRHDHVRVRLLSLMGLTDLLGTEPHNPLVPATAVVDPDENFAREHDFRDPDPSR